jgi:predicted metal-dependent HD superfamily phosphohydrolase
MHATASLISGVSFVRRHGCETTRAEVVRDELLRAYSEPNRKYQTIEHIGSLLSQMEEHGHAVFDRDAVVLAMLFHDVVYDPLRHDNEEKSEAIAGERLTFLGFPGGVIAKVEQYIYATKHAQDFVKCDCDLAVLLDRDLSTLATAPAEYRTYAQVIRREYAHVPDERIDRDVGESSRGSLDFSEFTLPITFMRSGKSAHAPIPPAR